MIARLSESELSASFSRSVGSFYGVYLCVEPWVFLLWCGLRVQAGNSGSGAFRPSPFVSVCEGVELCVGGFSSKSGLISWNVLISSSFFRNHRQTDVFPSFSFVCFHEREELDRRKKNFRPSGTLIQFFSFVCVLVSVSMSKSTAGISTKMLHVYAILLVARCYAVVPFEGYLPFDKTGDW